MPIKFQKLWESHPLNGNPPNNYPCDGKGKDGTLAFKNQCAIKMSIALMGAGVNLNPAPTKCWYGHKNHVLRAQELADWMATAAVLGKPTKYVKKGGVTDGAFQQTVLKDVNGVNGAAFFKDFWVPDGQTAASGDHIDVWNGNNMAGDADNLKLEYFGRAKKSGFGA